MFISRHKTAYAFRLGCNKKTMEILRVAIAIIGIITDEFSRKRLLLVIRFKPYVARKKGPFLKRKYHIINNKDTLGKSR